MGRERSISPSRRGKYRALFALSALLALGAACYSQGDGADPPLDRFYFPVGLQVSHGGSVLYVANADFDLQYNGGTLQSYDLTLIRRHAVELLANPARPTLPPEVWVRQPVLDANGTPQAFLDVLVHQITDTHSASSPISVAVVLMSSMMSFTSL